MSFPNFLPRDFGSLDLKEGKRKWRNNGQELFIRCTKYKVMHTNRDIHGDVIFHFIAQDKSRLGSGGKI